MLPEYITMAMAALRVFVECMERGRVGPPDVLSKYTEMPMAVVQL